MTRENTFCQDPQGKTGGQEGVVARVQHDMLRGLQVEQARCRGGGQGGILPCVTS